jgi:outer membrane protein insertion porin family
MRRDKTITGMIGWMAVAALGWAGLSAGQPAATDKPQETPSAAAAAPKDTAPMTTTPKPAAATRPKLDGLRIARIEPAGNVTLTPEQVLSAVRSREGETFDSKAVEEDIQRLAKLEGVEYAYYNTEVVNNEVRLIYVVVEKNLVRSIAIHGNRQFNDTRLIQELSFRKGDYLDPLAAAKGSESFRQLYLTKGYPFVTVTLDSGKLTVGQVDYTIGEGTRVRVRQVKFEGNKFLPSNELKKVIKTWPRSLLIFPNYYDKDILDADVEKLKGAYQRKAFLNADITASAQFTTDQKGAIVTFTIVEGKEYTVESLTLKGNQVFDAATLLADTKLKQGWAYTPQRGDSDAKTIQAQYRAAGYVDAKVEHNRSFVGEGNVTVEFVVTEGERYRIGQIEIAGNQEIQDRSVRRILDEEGFRPGQWYDANAARGDGKGELEILMKRYVLANDVVIEPMEPKGQTRDARVNLNEGQTGSVMFGAGVSTDSGVIGQVIYDQRNFDIADWPESWGELLTGKSFKGAGQRLRASINPGTVQSSFSISFTEPYLFDKPMSMDTVLSGYQRARESYDEQRLKGYLALEKRYDNKWSRGIGVRAEEVRVSGLDYYAPREIRDVEGNNMLYGIRPYIDKNTTDNRFLPTKGYHFDAGYEQVTGDYTFGILDATQRWYQTLYEDLAERKTVLETKVHGATTVGDAPPFEKFYAGGSTSLRGFRYRGVSTRGKRYHPGTPGLSSEKKYPIGSEWILTGSAEVMVPLDSEYLSWLFFLDTGMIDTGGPRASIGTGIQISIPQWFGPVPMRLELGVPFLKEGDDETRIFSISMGALF